MKKIFKVAFVAALVMAAGYNVYSSRSEAKLSEVMLDNVEALANIENDGNYTIIKKDGETTMTESGSYTTVCTSYTITCMPGGNSDCTPGSGKDCVTIKRG